MPQPHTGEIFKDTILTIVAEFGIEDKILALITDNASNMLYGVNQLSTEIYSKYGRRIYHI
jgi:hypothetical protein